MTNILIANIGSRDVQLDPALLPEHLRPKDGKPPPERERGAYLGGRYAELAGQMRLPILDKARMFITSAGRLDHVVLIASDQRDPAYRATDTIATAEVARQLIINRWGLVPERVLLQPLSDVNPSNIDAVLRFLERRLPELDAGLSPNVAYLEVAGGTPAMNQALLMGATEVFRERAVVLYVSPASPMPAELAVGKRLLAGPLRDVLKAHLASFQYAAAWKAWEQLRPYLVDSGRAAVIGGLIQHAASRISLDLPGAVRHLHGLGSLDNGRYQDLLADLYADTAQPARADLLAQVLHVALVRQESAAYNELLTQVVRFVENALRLLCLDHGAQFVNWQDQPDPSGARLAAAWAQANGVAAKGVVGQRALQDMLKKIAPADPRGVALLAAAGRLKKLIQLRNETTHSLGGIAERDLVAAFGDAPAAIPRYLGEIYARITGAALPANPYHRINAEIATLLEGA